MIPAWLQVILFITFSLLFLRLIVWWATNSDNKERIKAKKNGCICDYGIFVITQYKECPYHFPNEKVNLSEKDDKG
jgi:protein-S-isoprenylcysteine O-methyltransferase Ste14